LERKLEEAEALKAAEDEQTALLEKSYQLAAKYMPQAAEQVTADQGTTISTKEKPLFSL
jgi:hypothetical protein